MVRPKASMNRTGGGREGPLELLLKAEQMQAPVLPRWQQWLLVVENWPWWTKAAQAGGGVVAVLVLLAMWWWWPMLQDRAAQGLAQATGATVQSIPVTGAVHTDEAAILGALGLQKGASLVGFDARAARARLEQLPWVRLASVERLLPATVRVTLFEHAPLARLVAEGQIWVLNQDGARLVPDVANQFASLPLLRGEQAERAAPELFVAMANWPTLENQLREAVWVGDRRWDLRFASGLTVQLPEVAGNNGLAQPLAELAELEAARHVLSLPDGVVDLRLADRIVLRLPETVGPTPVTNQQAPGGAQTAVPGAQG